MKDNRKIEAIDLFCGIWGLTYGLRESWINVLAGLDFDSSCEQVYEKNNKCKFISADISEYDFKEMKDMYSKDSVRVLVWCAPCQPFSSHTFKKKNKQDDMRWNLINYFVDAIKELDPHIISMENVRGITKTDVFKDFIKQIEELWYEVDYDVVYCPNYWIPQNRSRLVLLGSKIWKINLPKSTHTKDEYVSVKDVIKPLPKIEAWQTDKKDIMHRAKWLSDTNLQRIKQSKPKWSRHDRDEKLLPNCYKKKSWQTYTAVYWRMSREEVSPTITTQFFSYWSGRFWHPEQDRWLSLREWALLQTFPKDYDFWENITLAKVGRWIWNAVPPKLWTIIGKEIKNHFL